MDSSFHLGELWPQEFVLSLVTLRTTNLATRGRVGNTRLLREWSNSSGRWTSSQGSQTRRRRCCVLKVGPGGCFLVCHSFQSIDEDRFVLFPDPSLPQTSPCHSPVDAHLPAAPLITLATTVLHVPVQGFWRAAVLQWRAPSHAICRWRACGHQPGDPRFGSRCSEPGRHETHGGHR